MPAPAKPKKTIRNRPDVFDEMIIATLPAPSPRAQARTKGNPKAAKTALIMVWVLAMLSAGIGLGRLIMNYSRPASTIPGYPVAKSTLTVSPVNTSDVLFAQVQTVDQLGLSAATAPIQAQHGSTFQTMSVAAIQGTSASDALQPDYNHLGRLQGNIGTNPSN